MLFRIAINLPFSPKHSLIGKMYHSMHDLKHTPRSLGVLFLGFGFKKKKKKAFERQRGVPCSRSSAAAAARSGITCQGQGRVRLAGVSVSPERLPRARGTAGLRLLPPALPRGRPRRAPPAAAAVGAGSGRGWRRHRRLRRRGSSRRTRCRRLGSPTTTGCPRGTARSVAVRARPGQPRNPRDPPRAGRGRGRGEGMELSLSTWGRSPPRAAGAAVEGPPWRVEPRSCWLRAQRKAGKLSWNGCVFWLVLLVFCGFVWVLCLLDALVSGSVYVQYIRLGERPKNVTVFLFWLLCSFRFFFFFPLRPVLYQPICSMS